MTYRELLLQAELKLDHNDITLGEFEQMIAPLNREVDVLDKIRAELHANAEMHDDSDYYLRDEWIDEIFDKYKAESEDT